MDLSVKHIHLAIWHFIEHYNIAINYRLLIYSVKQIVDRWPRSVWQAMLFIKADRVSTPTNGVRNKQNLIRYQLSLAQWTVKH